MEKSKLEKRFDKEIKKRSFTLLEITGFKDKPSLALKAGMAIGYSMAIDDASQSVPAQDVMRCEKCGETEPVLYCENCGHTWPRL